jgi:hypothetical protein
MRIHQGRKWLVSKSGLRMEDPLAVIFFDLGIKAVLEAAVPFSAYNVLH